VRAVGQAQLRADPLVRSERAGTPPRSRQGRWEHVDQLLHGASAGL